MPLTPKAKKEKDENLNQIGLILKEIKNGKTDVRTFQEAKLIEPCMYLTIHTEIGSDSHHKRGYVIDLDPRSQKPVSARYFIAEGPATYTEVDLSMKQFYDLVDYYKIEDLDIWYMFHKRVG